MADGADDGFEIPSVDRLFTFSLDDFYGTLKVRGPDLEQFPPIFGQILVNLSP